MSIETLVAFTIVTFFSTFSPGPAIALAIRNAVSYGMGAVIWSSLGNIIGVCCLSAAVMLHVGVLLHNYAHLFDAVKITGALYLFYIGFKQILACSVEPVETTGKSQTTRRPASFRLFIEAYLLAITNPKPILFFTALFPHFLTMKASIVLQFVTLTGLFMCFSFSALISYATLATRSTNSFNKQNYVKWFNRLAGLVFIFFGVTLLALHEPHSLTDLQ